MSGADGRALERLAGDLPRFAPELISDPVSRCIAIIATHAQRRQDPVKTARGRALSEQRLRRGEGSGLYVEIAPTWVWIGGGLYMPPSSDLRLIRAHIADHHRALHRIVSGAPFKRAVRRLDGERLSGMPRGYLKDHPAAYYLRYKQFLAGREYVAEFATTPRFYPELLRIFRAVAPLVRFLNRRCEGRRTVIADAADRRSRADARSPAKTSASAGCSVEMVTRTAGADRIRKRWPAATAHAALRHAWTTCARHATGSRY